MRSVRARLIVALLALPLVASIAAATGVGDPATSTVATARRVLLGRSVQARAITATVVGPDTATRKLLVVGCVHGDECAGLAITSALARTTPHGDVQARIVPELKPDGTAAGTRQNARGVDLNRNFAYRWAPIADPTYYAGPRPESEPETRIARALARHLGALRGLERGERTGSRTRRDSLAQAAARVPRPPIVHWWIPYGPVRRSQMAAYAQRHYGIDSYRLTGPRVIVEHVSDAPTAQADYDTFAPDVPDVELHELPQVCAHFVIDGSGTIYQLVPTSIMCRHTVGLNYTAIGIEHTGFSDPDVLDNPRQLAASLELTRFLRCRFHIPIRDVIGHNESLSSPYHHERVAALRTQTHDDMRRASMVRYRRALARLGGC
jgi:beta-N-acetylhexosaminidase